MRDLTCLGSVRVGGLCVDALVVLHILERKVHQTSGTSMVALVVLTFVFMINSSQGPQPTPT